MIQKILTITLMSVLAHCALMLPSNNEHPTIVNLSPNRSALSLNLAGSNLTKSKRQLSACYSNPCNYGTCYDVALAQKMVTGFYCVCSAGYTGTQCEKEINECSSNPCQNGAQCLDLVGSFFCSCPTGFSGVLCEKQTITKICPENACGDGECVLTTHPTHQYACKCKDNSYKFEPCSSTNSVNKCASQPCGSNLCIEAPNSPTGFVCQCGPNDFRTSSCESLSVIEGCKLNSCLNGGTCVPYSESEGWCNPIQTGQTCCQCVTGYTGYRCETEINECVSNPCKNGGICENLVNSYKCTCPSGYTGANCEQAEGCANNPCKFGGTCTVTANGSEKCQCKDGFTGTNCEIDINECLSSPCQNGGTCIDLENSYACYCPDGYFRPTFCPASSFTAIPTQKQETSLPDLCPNQSICQNQGVCRIVGSTFICVCPEGYFGSLCELKESQLSVPFSTISTSCLPNPCKNHATCISYDSGEFYGCLCQIGYSGKFCELVTENQIIYVDPCNPNPCFNGGTCILSHNGDFAGCFCKTFEFFGPYCQNFSPSTSTTTVASTTTANCFPNPCFNGGVCSSQGCICPSGYSGQFCETLITADLCRNIKCQNGGACNVVLRGSVPTAECWCLKNYAGFYCEISIIPDSNKCSEIKCLNNGTCSETLTGVSPSAFCNCKPGFTGSRCETEYFRCSKDGIFTDIYGCTSGRYLECVYFGQSSVGLSNGILFRRDCPPGLRFNPNFGYCDYATNFKCPGE